MKKLISSVLLTNAVALGILSSSVLASNKVSSPEFIYVDEVEENVFVSSKLRTTVQWQVLLNLIIYMKWKMVLFYLMLMGIHTKC